MRIFPPCFSCVTRNTKGNCDENYDVLDTGFESTSPHILQLQNLLSAGQEKQPEPENTGSHVSSSHLMSPVKAESSTIFPPLRRDRTLYRAIVCGEGRVLIAGRWAESGAGEEPTQRPVWHLGTELPTWSQ